MQSIAFISLVNDLISMTGYGSAYIWQDIRYHKCLLLLMHKYKAQL